MSKDTCDKKILFFVDSHQQKTVKVEKEGKMKQKPKSDVVSILLLHHNVQSINNKLLELNVLLQSELADVDILCLSEHWLREEHTKLISTDIFQLASNFSRSKIDHGSSYIYVKHRVQTKEINYVQGISNEKVIKNSSQVPRNKSLKYFIRMLES
jgi:hypothetical protein